MSVSILLNDKEQMFEFVWTLNGERKEALIIEKSKELAEVKLRETYGITSYDEVAVR